MALCDVMAGQLFNHDGGIEFTVSRSKYFFCVNAKGNQSLTCATDSGVRMYLRI
jgi:hypothetical protein